MTLQTCDLNCAAVQPWVCAWPVRISRAAVAAAVSSDWSAKNRIAVCRIAKIKATNGAAKRPNSTVVDALRCEMKRRGSGDVSSRTARAEIFGFSCSNMSPSPSAVAHRREPTVKHYPAAIGDRLQRLRLTGDAL